MHIQKNSGNTPVFRGSLAYSSKAYIYKSLKYNYNDLTLKANKSGKPVNQNAFEECRNLAFAIIRNMELVIRKFHKDISMGISWSSHKKGKTSIILYNTKIKSDSKELAVFDFGVDEVDGKNLKKLLKTVKDLKNISVSDVEKDMYISASQNLRERASSHNNSIANYISCLILARRLNKFAKYIQEPANHISETLQDFKLGRARRKQMKTFERIKITNTGKKQRPLTEREKISKRNNQIRDNMLKSIDFLNPSR